MEIVDQPHIACNYELVLIVSRGVYVKQSLPT